MAPPALVHRFRSGKKPRHVRCLCGKTTWGDAILYWRSVPRWLVLQKEVNYCDEPNTPTVSTDASREASGGG